MISRRQSQACTTIALGFALGILFLIVFIGRSAAETAVAFTSKYKIKEVTGQLNFLNSGGAMVEYDSRKIRSELHSLFADGLKGISKRMNC